MACAAPNHNDQPSDGLPLLCRSAFFGLKVLLGSPAPACAAKHELLEHLRPHSQPVPGLSGGAMYSGKHLAAAFPPAACVVYAPMPVVQVVEVEQLACQQA